MNKEDPLRSDDDTGNSSEEVFASHLKRAGELLDSAEWEQSREYYHRAFELAAPADRADEIPGIFANIGASYSRAGDQIESALWIRKALDALEHYPNNKYEGRIHFNWGNHCAAVSEFEEALHQYDLALSYFSSHNMRKEYAEVLNNKGIAYGNKMEFDAAIICFEESLAVREEIQDEQGISYSLGNIGALYMHINELDKACEYSEKSLQVKMRLGDHRGISGALCNIGEAHRKMKNYDSALEYYKRAEHESVSNGVSHFLPTIFFCLGTLYYQVDNIPESLQYILKSYDLSVQRADHSVTARALMMLGKLYLTESLLDLPRAHRYLYDALRYDEQSKTRNYELLEALSMLKAKEGDYKKSLEFYQEYHAYKEEALSENVKKTAIAFDIDRKIAEREKNFAIERATLASERRILNNILPTEITARLINGESPIADTFDSVSILFMDIVDFTALSTRVSAQQLVYLLNGIFAAADSVMREFGLEKIKTIGDAYMAVAGAPVVQSDHVIRAANAALKLRDVMSTLVVSFPEHLGDLEWISSLPAISVRIGLHCGPAAAGVVGDNKFLYDLWGDAVNTASRMESSGEPGKIHVSQDFMQAVYEQESENHAVQMQFRFIDRGEVVIKGKGSMHTYFLEQQR